MKRAWWVVPALALLVSGCDMRSPAEKKKAAEEEARKKAAANAPPVVRPEPPEEAHVLVKADASQVTQVQRPAVGLTRIGRDGVITCAVLKFNGPNTARENIGASSASGCCSSSDPPEMQSMGGAYARLRGSLCSADSPPCDEPVILDADYKAQWMHVRKAVEMMARAHMTRLVFATSVKEQDIRGVVAKIPEGWNVTDPLPAAAKRVEVAAKGKELEITIDGAAHKDVASAAAALQKAGVKEIGIHPADPKTPLWAVVKGVELSNTIAPGGPVRFVMVDR